LDSIYDHAILVPYPVFPASEVGVDGRDASITDILFGSHSQSWRIVLPGSPDMALRMGLLGRRTSSLSYHSIVGMTEMFANSTYMGGPPAAAAAGACPKEGTRVGAQDLEDDDSALDAYDGEEELQGEEEEI
jgi:hypothetical protein